MKSEPKHNDSNQIIQKEWERMLTEDFDKPEASAFASIDMYIFTYRVSPKKGDLRVHFELGIKVGAFLESSGSQL